MSKEPPHDFSQRWCIAIAKDPAWKLSPTPSLVLHPTTTENSLLAETLSTTRGARAVQTYLKKSPDAAAPLQDMAEVRMVISSGDGVNGMAETCHGGLIGLVFDEVTAQLAAEVFGRYNIITAGLKVAYKRKLSSPAVVARCVGFWRRGARDGLRACLPIQQLSQTSCGGSFSSSALAWMGSAPSLR